MIPLSVVHKAQVRDSVYYKIRTNVGVLKLHVVLSASSWAITNNPLASSGGKCLDMDSGPARTLKRATDPQVMELTYLVQKRTMELRRLSIKRVFTLRFHPFHPFQPRTMAGWPATLETDRYFLSSSKTNVIERGENSDFHLGEPLGQGTAQHENPVDAVFIAQSRIVAPWELVCWTSRWKVSAKFAIINC